MTYEGLTGEPFQFSTTAFDTPTEFTGHIKANLVMGVRGSDGKPAPKDLDVLVTLRHIGADGKEIFYTGTAGDPVPLCKGFLRASLRAIDESSPLHRDYLPFRKYSKKDVSYLKEGEKYNLLIEVWPTSVVVEKGARIIFEVSPKDTQGGGIFTHDHPQDRSEENFAGKNVLFLGPQEENWVELPLIPDSVQ